MSIESEILRIQHNVANAYAAVSEKGGEVPLQPTSANLAAAVESIPSGGSITPGDEVYSTEEQRIGTWIDGKPLYRRVYKLTTPSSTSGGVTIGTIEANINVVSIDGYMITSVGVHQPINSVYGGNTVGTVTRDTNIKMIVTHGDYTSRPCWVVLEYTKTTDTATTALSAQPDATIKLSNSALDLSSIQAAPVTAATAGVEIAKMEEV